MKYAKFISQFLIIAYSIFLIATHLIPNQLQGIMEQTEPSSLSLLVIPIILFGSIFIPTASLVGSGYLISSILQVICILVFTVVWILLFEKLYVYYQKAQKKGLNSASTFELFGQAQKLFAFEIVLYAFTNILFILYTYFSNPTALEMEPAFIPYNSLANLIFALPFHQIFVLVISIVIGILYKNNVSLKRDQDSIV
jgi:hypothetical protein